MRSIQYRVRCEIDERALYMERKCSIRCGKSGVPRNGPKDLRVVGTRPPHSKEALFPRIHNGIEETRTMLKKLMITTASLALLTGAAIAQAPDQPKQSPPAATTDQPKQSPPAATTEQPKSPPAATADKSADKNQVITEQKPDQLLASKVKGTNVIGSNDEKVGDVSDILFDKEGKILAYVVGVGGFLGLGAKDVALSPASFQVMPASDREKMKLKISMTKDELKNASEFKPYKEPSSTTGQSPSPNRTPMTPPNAR